MATSDYVLELGERGFGPVGAAVCLDCVYDASLRDELKGQLSERACSFCGREVGEDAQPIAADFELLMEAVLGAIRFLYQRALDVLFLHDDVTPRYSSWDVAFEVCESAVAEVVLEAVQEAIDDEEWVDDPGILPPDEALRRAWQDFKEVIKHRTRFVFLSLHEEDTNRPDEFTTLGTIQKLAEIIERRGLVKTLAPGHTFWRGRMIDAPTIDGYTAAELGSPPLERAAANRMSPAGISMFYGSDDAPTAVAEISAHSPKAFAVLGQFETTRALHVVDLTDLPTPRLFDPEAREGYYEARFLQLFARDLSAPVTLDGREHVDYVPTQVVTEYLRWMPQFEVDGLLFASAQNGETSSVLFVDPDGCSDTGSETEKTVLRMVPGSVHVLTRDGHAV